MERQWERTTKFLLIGIFLLGSALARWLWLADRSASAYIASSNFGPPKTTTAAEAFRLAELSLPALGEADARSEARVALDPQECLERVGEIRGRLKSFEDVPSLAGIQVAALPLQLGYLRDEKQRAEQLEHLRRTTSRSMGDGSFRLTGLDPGETYVLRAVDVRFVCLNSGQYRCGEEALLQLGALRGIEVGLEDLQAQLGPSALRPELQLKSSRMMYATITGPQAAVVLEWLDPGMETADCLYLIGAFSTGFIGTPKLSLVRPKAESFPIPSTPFGPLAQGHFPRVTWSQYEGSDHGYVQMRSEFVTGVLIDPGRKFRGQLKLTDGMNGKVYRISVEQDQRAKVPAGTFWVSFRDNQHKGDWKIRPNPLTVSVGQLEYLTAQPPIDAVEDWRQLLENSQAPRRPR